MLQYTYTAYGRKISQQLEDDGRLGTRHDYAGPFCYVNITLGRLSIGDFTDHINSLPFIRTPFSDDEVHHLARIILTRTGHLIAD